MKVKINLIIIFIVTLYSSISSYGRLLEGLGVESRKTTKPLNGSSQSYLNSLFGSKSSYKDLALDKATFSATPRLHPPDEELLDKDFLSLNKNIYFLMHDKGSKKLESPSVLDKKTYKKWASVKWIRKSKYKRLKKLDWGVQEAVTLEKLSALLSPQSLQTVVNIETKDLKPVHSFTKEDLKWLSANILLDKGKNCHQAIGLLYYLRNSKKYKREIEYPMGHCLMEMGFRTEGYRYLFQVLNHNDWIHFGKTIQALIKEGVPRDREKEFFYLFENSERMAHVGTQFLNDVNYYRAKGAYRANQITLALKYSSLVKDPSEKFLSALYLKALSYFSKKEISMAQSILENLEKKLEKDSLGNKDLKTLVSLTLARLYFNQSEYKLAYQHYLKVPKTHNLWIEALTEQGWTQLALGDYDGAIGNMYSLQSPYFQSVYKPETYVIRTIGYLNICQYGDAYGSLTHLEKDYQFWKSSVDKYISRNSNPLDYYLTVNHYLSNISNQQGSGSLASKMMISNNSQLPIPILKEVGRQKDFLVAQKEINQIEDEKQQHHYISNMITKDMRKLRHRLNSSKKRLLDLKKKIKMANKKPALEKYLTEWNQQKIFEARTSLQLKFYLEVLKESAIDYTHLISVSRMELNKIRDQQVKVAGNSVKLQFKKLSQQMSHLFDNNELLRYEVYAGSGENIRYQVVGGKTNDSMQRIPASVKPPKSLEWKFEGEYWEDEIGSYRSTLKNKCPEKRK